MSRSASRHVVATTANVARTPRTRDVEFVGLLGKLARRASSWGWLSTYERVRRGEMVPRWHLGMMKLSLAKRSGEFQPPRDGNDE